MSTPAADARLRRRQLLETASAPATHAEYLVTLADRLTVEPAGPVTLTVRYVPDRRVVAPEAFAAYSAALGEAPWPSLEHLAAAVLDDFNNELVPRWIQVRLGGATGGPADGGRPGHEILLEDQQPRWENEALLSRLKRV